MSRDQHHELLGRRNDRRSRGRGARRDQRDGRKQQGDPGPTGHPVKPNGCFAARGLPAVAGFDAVVDAAFLASARAWAPEMSASVTLWSDAGAAADVAPEVFVAPEAFVAVDTAVVFVVGFGFAAGALGGVVDVPVAIVTDVGNAAGNVQDFEPVTGSTYASTRPSVLYGGCVFWPWTRS